MKHNFVRKSDFLFFKIQQIRISSQKRRVFEVRQVRGALWKCVMSVGISLEKREKETQNF